MNDTIFVTELKLNNEVVYRRELHGIKQENISFRQFLADAITGEEIKDNEARSRT